MRNPFQLPAILLLCIFLLVSCGKKEDVLYWDADILTPLVKSEITLSDLIRDSSILKSSSDSSVMLLYDGDLYTFAVDSVLAVPDTTIENSYYMPLPSIYFSPGTAVMPPVNDQTKYDLNGVELTETRIRSGYSQLEITSHFNEPVIVEYKIPSAKDVSGNLFAVKITVPAAAKGSTAFISQKFDLTGYEIDMRGSAGNKVNTLQSAISAVLCDVSTCPGAQGDTVFQGEGISIKNSFLSIVPAYAKGYFGKNGFAIGPEESVFDLFKGVSGGTLLLEQATVKLTIENGLGIDSRVMIKELYSKNSQNGSKNSLSSSYINSSINIDRATETGNASGPVAPSRKIIILDNSNSNIKTLMENLPDRMGYSLQLTTNPMGNLSGSNDFVYADNGLKTKLNIQVPLSISVNNVTFTDTALTDFSNIKDKNRINHGKFILQVTNGFPFDATLQVFLLDANLTVTDSLLLGNNTVFSAPLDAGGRAAGTNLSILEIPVSKEKIDKVLSTGKILIRATLNTANKPQLVKLYTDNKMEVKLIGDFNYRVEMK